MLERICRCKDCEEKLRREKEHLEHPFYKKVDKVTGEIATEQILKGANKYREPFNPGSWTNKELVKHQLQELRDAQVYGVGLLERLEEQEAEIEKRKYAIAENCDLRMEIERLKTELGILKGQEGAEEQYLYILKDVLENGVEKADRTGTGVLSVFGKHRMIIDLQKGFPLLTTKKMNLKKVMAEYLAFIRAETNANVITDKYDFSIWEMWADENGELGPIYGKQWRDWEPNRDVPTGGGIDQLQNVIHQIISNPNSRRLIVSAWNVGELEEMSLPPCHLLFQFNVTNGRLNCELYQRSGDLFLGIPYNMAGYAALTHMVAQLTGLEVGTLTHVIADAHIYKDHIEQVKTQLAREPRELPQLNIHPQENINDYWFDHFDLRAYDPYPAIKGEVSK